MLCPYCHRKMTRDDILYDKNHKKKRYRCFPCKYLIFWVTEKESKKLLKSLDESEGFTKVHYKGR